MKNKNGFTIIELIVVILLLGVVATIIGPRFISSTSFSSRANRDKVKFILKTGQKAALAQRRDIYPMVNSGELILCYSNTNPCPTNQKFTVNNRVFSVSANGTNIVIPNFKFNALGNTGTSKITIQVGGKNLYIEEESGYIHE